MQHTKHHFLCLRSLVFYTFHLHESFFVRVCCCFSTIYLQESEHIVFWFLCKRSIEHTPKRYSKTVFPGVIFRLLICFLRYCGYSIACIMLLAEKREIYSVLGLPLFSCAGVACEPSQVCEIRGNLPWQNIKRIMNYSRARCCSSQATEVLKVKGTCVQVPACTMV